MELTGLRNAAPENSEVAIWLNCISYVAHPA